MQKSILKNIQRRQLISKALLSTCLSFLLLISSQIVVLHTTDGSVVAAENSKATPVKNNLKTEKDINVAVEDILKQIERKVTEISDKLINKKNTAQAEKELRKLQQELDKLNILALKDFENIEDDLIKQKASAKMLQRHRDVVALYEKEVKTLNDNIDEVIKAPSLKLKKKKISIAKGQFDRINKKTARLPNDPKHNPHRALKPKPNNKPKINKKAFQAAGLFNTPHIKLASHGSYDLSKLPGADDPAFLSETPEVKLSDAIKAKAAELEHNPVKIFNWVHDRTQWLPTFGAIQNADMVLKSYKGNAFDLASLLIALYRASDIPARYVHGVIDVSADKFMNWAGGFTSPEGAHDLVANAGMPISSLTAGGKIVGFRMEHIWVEAAIDFSPSRGAMNKAADSWIRLDPSFKQYEAEPAYDMHTLLNFDGDAHFQDYFNDPRDLTPYQYYSEKVTNHLNTNNPDWTLKGLYGHERIRPNKPVVNGNLRLLAASLPYKIQTTGYKAYQIPDILRTKITIQLAVNPKYAIDATYTVALSELGNDRLTLSYVPESAADDAVVEDYGALYSSPAYLIRVKPQLRRNGVVVAVGQGLGLGEKETVILNFYLPTFTGYQVVNKINAGAYTALVVQGLDSAITVPGQSMAKFRNHILQNKLGEKANDNNLGQYLFSLGKLWFYDAGFERNFYAKTLHVPYTQLPSQAIVSADLTVRYFFGIPKTVTGELFTIDIDTDVMAMGTLDNNTTRKKDFMLLAGLTGSSWEGLEIENLFGGYGVSAVEVIQTAKQQRVPIHFINSSNISTKLPLLSLSSEDITDIKNFVAAGYDVTAPQSEITIGRWRGTGLIMLNPATKSGPYLISGGLAGGGSVCGTTSKGDPKPCTIEEWDDEVYNYPFFTSAIRSAILKFAKTKKGMAYGLGCKDPSSNVPNVYCAFEYGLFDDYRIDCSGLIATAYYRVGFPFFRGRGCNEDEGECASYFTAQGQWDVISEFSFGSHPDLSNVKAGDLIFWYGGWTSRCPESKPNCTPNPRVDHVGIISYVGSTLAATKWVAAEGRPINMVGEYGFSDVGSGRLEKPSFHGFGSVLDD